MCRTLAGNGQSCRSRGDYDDVRRASVAKQRVVEAMRGAIVVRKQDGIPLLQEQLRSADKDMFELALTVAREFPGAEIDETLADELALTSPERQR